MCRHGLSLAQATNTTRRRVLEIANKPGDQGAEGAYRLSKARLTTMNNQPGRHE